MRKKPEMCPNILLPHATTSRLAVNDVVAADRPCSALMRSFSWVHLAIHMTADWLGLVLHMPCCHGRHCRSVLLGVGLWTSVIDGGYKRLYSLLCGSWEGLVLMVQTLVPSVTSLTSLYQPHGVLVLTPFSFPCTIPSPTLNTLQHYQVFSYSFNNNQPFLQQ
jgi:hypothetical protein